MLTVSDYGASDALSPTYSITHGAFNSTPLDALNRGSGAGGFSSPLRRGGLRRGMAASPNVPQKQVYLLTQFSQLRPAPEGRLSARN
jgi:hypothetical protein